MRKKRFNIFCSIDRFDFIFDLALSDPGKRLPMN